MQNLTRTCPAYAAPTARAARVAAAVVAALVLALAVALTCAMPQVALALDTAKCTARPNSDAGGDVLGATTTRITWEGQAAADEEISSLTLVLPEGTDFAVDSTRVTLLTGEDLMTRESVDTQVTSDGQQLTVAFAQPAPAGGYVRVEIYDVFFPAAGGQMQLTGEYTLADGQVSPIENIPAITVVGVSAVDQLTNWLENQEWVEKWNSNKFLRLFFNPPLLVSSVPIVFQGFLMAIAIVAVAFPLAIPIGLMLSLMRMARFRVLRGLATTYVNVVRGTPLFLQIYIAFFGLPLAGVQIPPFILGVIVLAMNSSAYLCEIFRAGIQSISKGQFEAARSLGMNGAQTMLFVIIPQTVRRVIPTMTSEFILLYKDTSMLAAVGVMEVVMYAKTIVASTGSITPYIAAACFYLIITLPLAKLVGSLEQRLAGNDTGKPKKKRKSKRGKGANGAGVSGGPVVPATLRAQEGEAVRRPDAVEGTGITPEQYSSL